MSNECVEALADFDIHPRIITLFMKKLFYCPREFELDKKKDGSAFRGRSQEQVKRRVESKKSQLGVESMSFLRCQDVGMTPTLSDD